MAVGKHIVSMLGTCSQVTLTLDRTDWKFGPTPINFMVVGIMVGNISVPIVFMNLNKRGNSNTKERYRLIKRLLKIIASYQIQCLLADREFIGREWFQVLINAHIPFAIRIKELFFLAVSSDEVEATWYRRYKHRWSIERMFLSMKTRGFNLEQTH